MALRVRAEGGAALGTLTRPVELPIDLTRVAPRALVRSLVLNYANGAATAVYAITAPRRIALRVDRRSSDQLAVHVEVALLEAGSRRRVAPLVERADGSGTPVLIEAGRYLIVAALLLPEQVELELQISATPVQTPVRGWAAGGGEARAHGLLEERLRGSGGGGAPAVGVVAAPLLMGLGGGGSEGLLEATALGEISGRLRSGDGGALTAVASAAPFHWIDAWGRAAGPLITANPASWSRTPVRGVGDSLQLRLRDGAGNALNLGGLEASLEVWDQRRLRLYGAYGVEVGAAAGTVSLTLGSEQMAALPEQAWWDLRLVDVASGQTVYLLQGTLAPVDRYSEPFPGD